MKNSDNDLDAIFNHDDSTNLFKQAKRKNIQQNVVINLILVLSTVAFLVIIKWWITPYLLTQDTAKVETYYTVFGANMYVGQWQEHPKLLGSSATAPVYKLVDGIPVELKTVQHKNNTVDAFVSSEHGVFRTNGQKVTTFMHPNVVYKEYNKDLTSLQEDTLYEVALSFSRSFTPEELESQFPESLTPSWLWLDVFDENEVKAMQKEQPIFTEDEVVGISTVDQSGARFENPAEHFQEDLKLSISKNRGTDKENLMQVKEAIDRESPEVIGAVVTGSANELQQLQQLDFVKNISIGASVHN